MSIRVISDSRDQHGFGEVRVDAVGVGELRIAFGDQNYTFPWVRAIPGHTTYMPPGQWAPVIQIVSEYMAPAPRSKYPPVGGARVTVTDFNRQHPLSLFLRSDWRLDGTGSYGYADKLLSQPMWEAFRDRLTPLAEWLVENLPRQVPQLDPHIVASHQNALRVAESTRSRWQEAERALIVARDALVAEEDRVAAALAAA